jgi:hypothetical protein
MRWCGLKFERSIIVLQVIYESFTTQQLRKRPTSTSGLAESTATFQEKDG